MDHSKMDHSHMAHGGMDHGDMNMPHRCNMNVRITPLLMRRPRSCCAIDVCTVCR